MIAIDASILILLSGGKPPVDPSTGQPIDLAKERVDAFIDENIKAGLNVIVPTPALAEFMVKFRDPGFIDQISQNPRWDLAPFDLKAAVEHASITRSAILSGDKREGLDVTWTKLKFDRQIVAIARCRGVETLLCDDGDLCTYARKKGVEAMSSWELPIPDHKRQHEIDGLDGTDDSEE